MAEKCDEPKLKVIHYKDNPVEMTSAEKDAIFGDGEKFFAEQRLFLQKKYPYKTKFEEPLDQLFWNTTWLPKIVRTETGEEFPLALAVLSEFVRRSSHRVITRSCNCRNAFDCKAYDKNMGCLHIGAPTAEEPESIARHVSVEEAIEYTKFAIGKGLIPYVGRLEVDHTLWGIYSGEPFITVCFCCTCCCQQLVSYKYEHPANQEFKWKQLDGVNLKMDLSKCVGEYCGVCTRKCSAEALIFKNGKLEWDSAKCRLCGRCYAECRRGVFTFETKDIRSTINKLCGRYEGLCGDLGFNGEDYAEAIIKNCPK